MFDRRWFKWWTALMMTIFTVGFIYLGHYCTEKACSVPHRSSTTGSGDGSGYRKWRRSGPAGFDDDVPNRMLESDFDGGLQMRVLFATEVEVWRRKRRWRHGFLAHSEDWWDDVWEAPGPGCWLAVRLLSQSETMRLSEFQKGVLGSSVAIPQDGPVGCMRTGPSCTTASRRHWTFEKDAPGTEGQLPSHHSRLVSRGAARVEKMVGSNVQV